MEVPQSQEGGGTPGQGYPQPEQDLGTPTSPSQDRTGVPLPLPSQDYGTPGQVTLGQVTSVASYVNVSSTSLFNQAYIWRDEAANLLIEESDVMIRLFQGINKAMMDYEKYKQDIAEGYTTLEKVKVRYLVPLIICIANIKRRHRLGVTLLTIISCCSSTRKPGMFILNIGSKK